jgi:hypothetical protein
MKCGWYREDLPWSDMLDHTPMAQKREVNYDKA